MDESYLEPLELASTDFCESLEELLESPELDMITICTPPTTHYELAMKVLRAGKHVLVEKPFCSTVEEAEEIFAYAKAHQLIAMPYQNRRFDSEMIAAREIVHSGELGDIFEVEFHFDRFRPEDERPQGTVYDGEFYGLGIHLLDKGISLFGIPDKVFYDIRTLRKPENPDDTFEMQLFYPDKKVILKVNQLIASEYPSLRINGKKGSLVKYGMDMQETYLKQNILPNQDGFGIDQQPITVTLANGEELSVEKRLTPIGDYGKVYDAMYATIKEGKPKLVSDESAIANIRILADGVQHPTPFIFEL
ncbi:Gfo/Idh/MocA family oxidoreductase [Enterococcus saccharolyticus]|uniref:Gfo/Idh/MocA family oxidoreductase n=1 Tax=Enterococcus TaxID=1350 RepID=UPI002D80ED74|nr:Gfo/Idh/MocA family oxidoreductase [Enterococcus saccharolyticus]